MIEIFAHRAIYQDRQNTIEGIENNLKAGFNIEIDVRKNNLGIYLAHDIEEEGELLENAFKIIRNYNKKVAIHVKENFNVQEIINLVLKYNLKENCFIFSTLDETINTQEVHVGHYHSFKKNFSDGKFFWCDESNGKWYDKKLFFENKKEHKIIITMSRELLEKSNLDEIKNEWKRLIELGADGICTDYPNELKIFVSDML